MIEWRHKSIKFQVGSSPLLHTTTLVGVNLPVGEFPQFTHSLIYTFSECLWLPRVGIDINLAIFNIRCCGQSSQIRFCPVANQLRQLSWACHKLAGVSLNIHGRDRSYYLHCLLVCTTTIALQWRHNERGSVSNHQPHDCLLNRWFRRRSKKTSKLRVTGLCAGTSSGTGEFLAQMASNAENVSIWWRHHATNTAYIWWRHDMETLSVLLTLCEGNSKSL